MSDDAPVLRGYNDGWNGLESRARAMYSSRHDRREYAVGHACANLERQAGAERRARSGPEPSRPTPDQLALWQAQRAVQALREVVHGHGDRDEALRLAAEVIDPSS